MQPITTAELVAKHAKYSTELRLLLAEQRALVSAKAYDEADSLDNDIAWCCGVLEAMEHLLLVRA